MTYQKVILKLKFHHNLHLKIRILYDTITHVLLLDIN